MYIAVVGRMNMAASVFPTGNWGGSSIRFLAWFGRIPHGAL